MYVYEFVLLYTGISINADASTKHLHRSYQIVHVKHTVNIYIYNIQLFDTHKHVYNILLKTTYTVYCTHPNKYLFKEKFPLI